MNRLFRFSLLLLIAALLYYGIQILFFSSEKKTVNIPSEPDGSFQVPSEILKKYKFQTARLEKAPNFERIILPGVISYDLKNTAKIGSRVSGKVEQIFVNEGDTVKKGQKVVAISSTELGEMEARYKKAHTRKESLFVQMERAKELYEKKIISAKEFESILMEFRTSKTEAENAYNALISYGLSSEEIAQILQGKTFSMNLFIRSPISGTITERNAMIGQAVTTNDTLFTVSDLSNLWVLLEVFEKDLYNVRVGQFAEISPLGSNLKKKAKVAHVGEVIDPNTRSAEIRLELPNPDKIFRPGQSVTSILEGSPYSESEKKIVFTLPSNSVHRIEGKNVVFIRLEGSKFQAKTVTIGKSIEDRVEILDGITPEEEVVTEGSFILKSQYLKI